MCSKEDENDKKTEHVTTDAKRPTNLRRFRTILLPNGRRITRYEAKKLAKKKQDAQVDVEFSDEDWRLLWEAIEEAWMYYEGETDVPSEHKSIKEKFKRLIHEEIEGKAD